jgi:ketosteroid isomerase-like protein
MATAASKKRTEFERYTEQIGRVYSDKDLDRYRELLDAEVEVTTPVFPKRIGLDELLQHFQVVTSVFKDDLLVEPIAVLDDGDWGFVQYRIAGTLVTGEAVELYECDRVHLRDGRAVKAHFHFDTAALRAKLGIPLDAADPRGHGALAS